MEQVKLLVKELSLVVHIFWKWGRNKVVHILSCFYLSYRKICCWVVESILVSDFYYNSYPTLNIDQTRLTIFWFEVFIDTMFTTPFWKKYVFNINNVFRLSTSFPVISKILFHYNQLWNHDNYQYFSSVWEATAVRLIILKHNIFTKIFKLTCCASFVKPLSEREGWLFLLLSKS